MRYNSIGINIDSIDKLILDIYNYVERINKTLNEITNVVDQTKNFYQCDTANQYRNKFESFRTNFDIIDKNLKGYAEDLIKLKNRYQTVDDNITNNIKGAISKMQDRKF